MIDRSLRLTIREREIMKASEETIVSRIKKNFRKPRTSTAKRSVVRAMAVVSNSEMGRDLTRVKFQKQEEIDRLAAEKLRAFLERLANKD